MSKQHSQKTPCSIVALSQPEETVDEEAFFRQYEQDVQICRDGRLLSRLPPPEENNVERY